MPLALALSACAPTGQLFLHVDTDAPVPPTPGVRVDPARPRALFDQLRIEILRDGAPALDRGARDFGVDEGMFQDGRVSIGIAPAVGDAGLSARVRLFRGDRVVAGEPPARITLERDVALPALGATDVVHLTVRLHVDDIGQPQSGDPDPGEPGPSEVGQWSGAQPVPCATAAGADEACVVGGAFYMGDPALGELGGGTDADQERLVVVSPFFIDLRPRTAGQFRTQARGGKLGFSGDYLEWSGDQDPTKTEAWCTIANGPSAGDPDDSRTRLPVNCISYDTGRILCLSYDRDLPTEAQFEFIASGRGAEWGYVWGNDEPDCASAVWGRGGVGVHIFYPDTCRPPDTIGGLLPSGSALLDRVTLIDPVSGESREVVDLAGNVGTWALDQWSRQDEAYWSQPGVFHDPLADLESPADGDAHSERGGGFYLPTAPLRAAFRQNLFGTNADPSAGVRCARPGAPK